MPDPSDLTVIIPTRGRSGVLARSLAALGAQTVRGFETIVVVDGMDQEVPRVEGVRTIAKEHGGPGAARNAGASIGDSSLVLFLGDDMVPEVDLVERHLGRHRRSPEKEAAVLGHVDWHPEVSRDRIARWMDWSSTQFDYRNIHGEEAGFGRFYSCNVSLKRDFFLAAGGFDEDFSFYYEDLDLGWRLNQRGLRLLYEPRARALHLHRYDRESLVRRFEGIARGERMMQRKHSWFSPWYANRMRTALNSPRASALWPRLVDLVPERLTLLRHPIEARANLRYYQRLAPFFFNSWDGDRDLEELQAYLGPKYDHNRLVHHREEVEQEEEAVGDEAEFYRTSETYLYDLTAFAMSGTKVPYLTDMRQVLAPGASVLDYGCGIGTDGIRLLEAGYRVSFCDFANPSTRYLRWRLKRRNLDAPLFDLDGDDIPSGFDAAFSFDVIEHVEDPEKFLAELEARARLVVVNLLEPAADDPHIHRPLPVQRLIERATARGLLRYRRYHGRSHLLIYKGDGSTPTVNRLRSRAEAWAGRYLR